MSLRLGSITDFWWVVLLRGIIALLFGLAIFAWPGITLAVLILLFAAFAFVDGLLMAIHSLVVIGTDGRWWLKLVQGLIGVGAGLAAFLWPGLTALVLLYIIAFYAIFGGVFQAAYGGLYRKKIRGDLLLIAGGVISVIFGVLLVLFPLAGALALIKVIGIFEVVFGVLLVLLAFEMLAAKAGKPSAA